MLTILLYAIALGLTIYIGWSIYRTRSLTREEALAALGVIVTLLLAQTTASAQVPEPTVIWLGQDGNDLAVSGCIGSGFALGNKGTIDNHIRITGLRNLNMLEQIDLHDSNGIPVGRWKFPCAYPIWNIETLKSGDQLDLYFEPVTIDSVQTQYTIVLRFSDGVHKELTVDGSTGMCCASQ